MTRKEKLRLIAEANERIEGTGFEVTEVYPYKLRRYGYVGQIMRTGDICPGQAQVFIRRFGADSLKRLTASNVTLAVYQGVPI